MGSNQNTKILFACVLGLKIWQDLLLNERTIIMDHSSYGLHKRDVDVDCLNVLIQLLGTPNAQLSKQGF